MGIALAVILAGLYSIVEHGRSEQNKIANDDGKIRRDLIRKISDGSNEDPEIFERVERAVSLIDSDRSDEAKKLLEEIHEDDPKNVRVLLELSLIELVEHYKPDAALPYLIEALRLEPYNDTLLGDIADVFLESGQLSEGLRFFRKMHDELPEVSAVVLRIGQLLYYKEDYKAALNILMPHTDSSFHHAQIKSLLARVYLSLGYVDEAITVYKEAEKELELEAHKDLISGDSGIDPLKWLESMQIEMAEGLIRRDVYELAEDILYKLSARTPSDPEVVKLMNLAKVGLRSNAG